MTIPLNIGQPSLALPFSIVTGGQLPSFPGVPPPAFTPAWVPSAASLGFIFQTAFDPSRVATLTQAQGQSLSIFENSTLFYASISTTYGSQGQDSDTFNLPDFGGGLPIYITSAAGQTQWGQTQGTPENNVTLTQQQLPASLGGSSSPISNAQFATGVQYIIQAEGMFPVSGAPTPTTVGMIYPFAAPLGGGVPDGFMSADGRILEIAQYRGLFALLGFTYGGDGHSTFALPDLRNRVPIGTGVGPDNQIFELGQERGTKQLILTDNNIPSLDAQSVSTLQPSLALNYVINTQGSLFTTGNASSMLGQVTLYAGQRIPDGWTLAQGQLLSIADYAELYSLIGTQFGGDGVNTFALPDLRGRTAIGTGGVNNLTIGDQQGNYEQTIGLENIPTIKVPPPGVQLEDDTGHILGDSITSKFDLKLVGVLPKATVEYSTDGVVWSQTYEAQEGPNKLYVRQINVLGQASNPTAPINFVLDTTSPQTPQVIVEGVGNPSPMLTETTASEQDSAVARTSSGRLSFIGIEDGARLRFSIDGGHNWSDSFHAQPGANAVKVKQVDLAGNESAASDIVRFQWDGSHTDPATTTISEHSTGGKLITVEYYGALSSGLGTDAIDMLIYGHQQSMVMPDDIEHIRLTENGLNNTVIGNDHDNVFEVLAGNWVIEGSGGYDTVKLFNPIADYAITQKSYNGELQATLYSSEGRVIVRGIDRIAFADAVLVKSDGHDIEQIDLLYEKILGRIPDPSGLAYWVQQINKGANIQDVAQAIAESPEFMQRYGNPSEEQFVEALYEAILNRSPDIQGLSHWVEALVVHGTTEGNLIVDLLLSPESQAGSLQQLSTDGLFVLA